MTTDTENSSPILQSVTAIVSAHLANNAVAASEVSNFIRSIHQTLTELEAKSLEASEASSYPANSRPEPAIPIDRSIDHEFLVCLEDGKRLRMLKRYLMAQYAMTPEDYRSKWGLPADYPMVAPALADQRRSRAIAVGLGKGRSRKSTRGRKDD